MDSRERDLPGSVDAERGIADLADRYGSDDSRGPQFDATYNDHVSGHSEPGINMRTAEANDIE